MAQDETTTSLCNLTEATARTGNVADRMSASRRLALFVPWRIVEVGAILGVHAAHFAFGWSLSKFNSGGLTKDFQGESLRQVLQALGPTYIKLGQILSSRPDLISPEIATRLAQLQECVEAKKPKDIRRLIARHLGREMESVFDQFDETPIATGSVAHVYRARLLDGNIVALKLIRPGVRWRIICDVAMLSAIATIFTMIPQLRLIPFASMLEEIRGVLLAQLDLSAEAANCNEFRANFSARSNVRLPEIYSTYSNEYILTMAFLEDLQRVDQVANLGASSDHLAKTSVLALFQMIFVDGFVHGDLHSGNLKFQNQKDLVLFDSGLVVRLDAKRKSDFTNFFRSIATNNGIECARIALETSTWQAKFFDWEKFESDMCELVDEHSGKTAAQFEVTLFAKELLDVFRRNGLRGTADFVTVILALVVFEGIAKQLSPSLDFQAEARDFLAKPAMPGTFRAIAPDVAPASKKPLDIFCITHLP